MSFSVWVRPTQTNWGAGSWGRIFAKEGSSGGFGTWEVVVPGGGGGKNKVKFGAGTDASTISVITSTTVAAQTLAHFTGSIWEDPTFRIKMWRDGISQGADNDATATTWDDDAGDLRIGSVSSGNRHVLAHHMHCALWLLGAGAFFSDEEAAALAAGMNPLQLRSDKLVFYTPLLFQGDVAQDGADWSGHHIGEAVEAGEYFAPNAPDGLANPVRFRGSRIVDAGGAAPVVPDPGFLAADYARRARSGIIRR
jgi:hypothetical protein